MQVCVTLLLAGALLALVASPAAARRSRTDQDFEFDDDAIALPPDDSSVEHSRRLHTPRSPHPAHPRRYVYDPHNALCRALICKKREICVLKDAFTALCTTNKYIIRNGDVLVPVDASASGVGEEGKEDEDDVFYESGPRPRTRDHGRPRARVRATDSDPIDDTRLESVGALDYEDVKPARCMGCPVHAQTAAGGVAGGGGFLCGSDNRTYSSLCRLDLHNCVRRTTGTGSESDSPVTLACRGFCPCAPPPRKHRPLHSPRRARRRYDQELRRRKLEMEHNEVLPERERERGSRRRYTPPAPLAVDDNSNDVGRDRECAFDEMADRLLDWFTVLMEEADVGDVTVTAGAVGTTVGFSAAAERAQFPRGCKPEVRWMFKHLDTDGDGELSADNLYSLRHDERERCLRPFLSSCGASGGSAGGLSRAEWCGCMRRAARPCTALARAHPSPHGGAYVPSCDGAGFYRPLQCHAALGVCWCVDAHGVELPASRTKGVPACPPAHIPNNTGTSLAAPRASAGEGDEGAPADDEDAVDGSGDGESAVRY